MKTWKQSLRQPLKTIFGIALMTLAAAIVCLCVGQALAAHTTKKALNRRFSTVGIPSVQESLDGDVDRGSFLLEDEFLSWLEKMTVENPDTVKQVARHGFLSAYIPELTPLNITQVKYLGQGSSGYYSYEPKPYAAPYSCAMLVITLDDVSQASPVTFNYLVEDLHAEDFPSYSDYYKYLFDNPDAERKTATSGYTVKLTGTVTDVVSMADGYRDPVGRTARLTLTMPTLEQIEAMNLVTGAQYIVYGMDYVDEYWKLIGTLNRSGMYDHVALEPYDPDLFRPLTSWEKYFNEQKAEKYPDDFGNLTQMVAQYDGVLLTYQQVLMLNSISMTLDVPVPQIYFQEIRDEETGRLLELRPKTEVTYTDANGETVTCDMEEYTQRYAIPTIARLEGSVEDFLNCEAGAPWRAALEQSAVNNQAFAVIGVDRMDYLADFSLLRSKIVEGRDFTAEEREDGSRVCILHESLAKANGIALGDTVTLNLYTTDYALPYQSEGQLNPSASFYFDTTPITETAEYTVVGFWWGEWLWPDVGRISEYAFSPNTVFVPKASVQTPMETRSSILFNTVVPQNGKINAFHQLAMSSGYAGRFKYNDQGYSVIAANFHNYESLAKQILAVGAVIYAVLLLLFLLLYPGAQKKNMRTMQSLGAGFARRFGHIMVLAMGIVLPSSLLGGWLGIALWDSMVVALQTTAESAVALQIEPGALTQVAAAQLIFALTLTVCVGIFVAAPRGMSARR